jgi:acyl-CoA thioesterase-1
LTDIAGMLSPSNFSPMARWLPVLLLPFLMPTSSFAQDAASPTPTAASPGVVLFLGDSLSAGYGLDNAAAMAFPALVQHKIQERALPYTVVNAGVSGDTSAGGLRRIDWLLRRPISLLVLELGGNDGLRGIAPAETRKNLQGIIDKARAKNPHLTVVIAGMRMPANFGADYVNRFAAIFPDLARANGAVLVPFILEGVGGRAEYNQRDQIHPTAEGHRLIAETLWPFLEPLLLKS